MTSPFVRTLVASLSLLACASCSSDSEPAIASSGGGAGGGGSAGKSGSSTTGGTTGSGGTTGTGGIDPTLAAQCSIDSSGSDCKVCLAVLCCDAVKACFGDATCMAAFATYQTCIREPGQADPVGCLSKFTRFTTGDAGKKHQDVVQCIITDCQTCGGVQGF